MASLDNATVQLISQLLGMFFAAGCIWGAIKGEIKSIHTSLTAHNDKITGLENSTNRAHSRLDDHIEKAHGRI